MNGIEKAVWGAGPGRRDRSSQWLAGPGLSAARSGASWPAGSQAGVGVCWVGGVSMRSVGDPSQGAPPLRPSLYLLALLFSLSLSRADPFSALSVISNNVTASLVSIHQSRKKPVLTLLKKKKKMPSVPPGDRASWVPSAGGTDRWRPAAPACHFTAAG